MRTFRDRAIFSMFLGALCVSRAAFAQTSPASSAPEPFRVELSTIEGCGTSQDLSREILKRTDRLRPARGGEPALTFFVRLSRADDSIHGELAIREANGGNPSVRDVPGGNCSEVLSAMALIAALTVDPLASPDRELPLPHTKALPEPRRAKARTPETSTNPAPEELAAEARARARTAWGVGQRINAHGAVMPGVTPGLAVHADVTLLGRGWVSPRLRVGVVVARSGGVRSEFGTADFEWVTARLGVCPLRLGSERGASLRPCAFVDAGRLRGEGSDIEPHREKAVFWSAAGAELSAELKLVGPLRVGGELGILLPFRRDRFYFAPDDDVHRVTWAGVSAGVGMGLLFF